VTLLTDRSNQPALDFYHKQGFKDSHMAVLRKMV
jgi:ribosomal protein S18 acetylase RimI-like enzyme